MGCRRPSGRAWRPWGCGTCWTFRPALRCGRRSLPGPVRSIRDSGVPANPGWRRQRRMVSAAELPEDGVRLRWPRPSCFGEAWRRASKSQATQLPFQRPEGATDQQAQARRNPLGRLPPEPGRQRTPLLPVQCSGGYPVGDPGIRGRLPLAYRNGV